MKRSLIVFFTLLGLALSAVGFTPARADSFVVTTTADSGAGSLRQAILDANANGAGVDTITFAANYTITLDSQLPAVTTEIIINGNGTANTIIQASTCNPLTLKDDGDNDCTPVTYRVFEVTSAGELTLDGLTVRHGRCDGSCATSGTYGGGVYNAGALTVSNVTFSANSAGAGGGMYNFDSSPTLTKVTFSGNSATWGSGMFNWNSSPMLTDVTFSANSADRDGGGMYNYESSPTLTNVIFSANSADKGGGMYGHKIGPTLTNVTFSANSAADGGGMYNYESTLTLTNVTFSANSAINYGGGMYNYESSPTLTNVTFSGNSATTYGGGMYNGNSSPTLTNVTFSGNSADWGGGMYNGNSSPTLTDVTFSGNSADWGGGGMYNNFNSSPALTDVTFSGNLADWGGGGMYNDYTSPTLTNVTFTGNTADWGGGMYNYYYSSPTLTNVTFSGNLASYNSGGMCNYYYSSPTLTDVTFSDNSANRDGGGMYNYWYSSPTLTNVTFSNNSAGEAGGGMFNIDNSSLTLTNVTFSGNSATNSGGGIHNNNNSPTLTNVILWGDSATNGPEIYNDNSTPKISYSDIQGCSGSGSDWVSTCGTDDGGNIDADPHFVDAASGNLRLQLTSPAIDAGSNDAVLAGVTTDRDGNPRFVDIPTVPNTGSGTPPIVDMGAYEAQSLNVALGKAVSPTSAVPGQGITFTLTLSNSGDSSFSATHIVVTDTLPTILSGLSFASTLVVTDTGHTPPYAWAVQDLAPGQGGIITVSAVLAVPLAAGTYTNTAVITAEGDLLAVDNTALVTFTVPNVAPVFSSAPITTATQGTPYTYTATAVDNNGDARTITAPTLPGWLTLTDHGDGTATLSGTPGSADVRQYAVVLRVTDGKGLFTEQVFTIAVAEKPRYAIFLPWVLRNIP